ncbi:MAG: arylsulfatase [Planctomycetota bacterium]
MPKYLLIMIVAITSALQMTLAHAEDRPPNIVVVLVDDMGFSDIGCYGGEIPTPNLDALATNGLRFSQFYNTGRCCPTRASLLTGLYPHQSGMGHMTQDLGLPGYRGALHKRCVTIAEALKPAGYFTAMTGKWHVGKEDGQRPAQRGFDRFFGSTFGGVFYDISTMGGKQFFLDDKMIANKDSDLPEGFYSTHAFADYAIQFIDEAREADKPFFLYLAHIAPHFPLQAPKETIAKHRGKYMQGWEKLQNERHKRQLEMELVDPNWPKAPRPGNVRPWNKLNDAEQNRMDHIMAIYAAVMEEMDNSIGTLVKALRERGELDNTLILFMSDNGGNAERGPMGVLDGGEWLGGPGSKVWCGKSWAWAQNTPFREFKHWVHEGGIATPLIAHWPKGIDPSLNGKWNDTPGHVIDIMATCLDVASAQYPEQNRGKQIIPLQGISLRPAFKGQAIERDAPIFWEHEGNRAIRGGKWKLVAKGINGPWQLYDLEQDRTEANNLIKKHPAIAKRLADAWEAWAKQANVYPMPNRSYWKKK